MSLTVALALSALAGCDAGKPATGADGTPSASPTGGTALPYASRVLPYRLYTHCGIDEARIDGHWYEAVDPLSDGNGNPPPGWGNPFQAGEVHLVSPTEAEFRDPAGHVVRLRLRAGATAPKRICS
ncbi:hypothetical protein EV384_1086 [Micromonospora kangleipakensis]|uniref:Uncharacterized protein n=1 Tax=Micromonospora kangleipakensis TaxID=1077942 RepID=A0A4V2GCN3_9ACTN|nr:hypothetical protein [Micromonospora kangleipakensis]RZU72706.1 hypothetical protein EV384_1086 [Micromonospora kangleipakensis]